MIFQEVESFLVFFSLCRITVCEIVREGVCVCVCMWELCFRGRV